MNEIKVYSPCIGVCVLDQQQECIGCGRNAVEIGEWGVMDNDQKRSVLQRIENSAKGGK